MILPLSIPQFDFKGLSTQLRKKSGLNPRKSTTARGYPEDDIRVLINTLRLKEDYNLSDPTVQHLIHIGYAIFLPEEYLTKIGCWVECNITEDGGVFVGNLNQWKSCVIKILSTDTIEELRVEVVSIYRHLVFLKLGYLFQDYHLRGSILKQKGK